jgi:Sulfotransferase family
MRGLLVPSQTAPRGRQLLAAARHPSLLTQNDCLFTRTISERDHIFVVGPPRSGTTLLAQILRAHPRIAALDIEAVSLFFRWHIEDFISAGIPGLKMRQFVDCSQDVIQLFDRIAYFVCASNSASRFMHKNPDEALKIPFIGKHFPKSKIVFMIRDGRDGFLSAQRHPSLANRGVNFYARIWRLCVKVRMRQLADNGQIIDVRYEDLCARPETEIRRVMSLVGEDFQDHQISLSSYSNTRLKDIAGHERLRDPITSRSVGAWRNEMSDQDLATFHRIAGRELRLMGYEV